MFEIVLRGIKLCYNCINTVLFFTALILSFNYFSLLDIVSAASQDSYVKLIVSSLYYGKEGNSRAVLSKALCASSEVDC